MSVWVDSKVKVEGNRAICNFLELVTNTYTYGFSFRQIQHRRFEVIQEETGNQVKKMTY